MVRQSLAEELSGNEYPGRGIVVGKSPDGKKGGSGVFYNGTQREQPQQGFC